MNTNQYHWRISINIQLPQRSDKFPLPHLLSGDDLSQWTSFWRSLAYPVIRQGWDRPTNQQNANKITFLRSWSWTFWGTLDLYSAWFIFSCKVFSFFDCSSCFERSLLISFSKFTIPFNKNQASLDENKQFIYVTVTKY